MTIAGANQGELYLQLVLNGRVLKYSAVFICISSFAPLSISRLKV